MHFSYLPIIFYNVSSLHNLPVALFIVGNGIYLISSRHFLPVFTFYEYLSLVVD